MATFVDPREDPRPNGAPSAASTDDPEPLDTLARICREGRIYEVEQWIRDGKPIVGSGPVKLGKRRVESCLEVAIETNQFDLARLLLCNGFPPDHGELLDFALEERKLAFVDLLLAWGADPLLVDASTVLHTYDSELCERFWTLGLDLTRGHVLARTLADQSSNQPAYGWARRHKDDPRVARELAIALLQAVVENRERATALLMWAGADPRKPVPDIRYARSDDVDDDDPWSTAMVHAVMYGHGHLLKSLKPNPELDDFEKLWTWACDEEAVDYLAKRKPPADWSRVLTRNLERALTYGGDRARSLVEKLTMAHDARLTAMSESEVVQLRREVLRCQDESKCRWVLRWMSYPETCDQAVFAELTRTASIQRKLKSLHIRDARYRY